MENTKKGRVTLPAQEGMDKEIIEIMKRWGTDAVRDSDGTKLSPEILKIAEKVYSTYFPTRGDQEWAKNHKDQLQQMYLMSKPITASGDIAEIDILEGYFAEQFEIDKIHDPKEWWEVIDRTEGTVVDANLWDFYTESGKVIIKQAQKWHVYTVNFLVYQIWDSTQMYNHITNNWGDKPHEMPYDARHPDTRQQMKKFMKDWLTEHPDTDVVRFTTFFYHFTLCFNDMAKEKFVDWFGYSSSVSPLAFKEFEKEKGYRLRPEDIVDEGYYNSTFRVPTSQYMDWIDYQQKFVVGLARELVELVHEAGKEAMMFLGDNWIGTEPYGKYFKHIGVDAVVGSVGNGATLRMISDIPGVKYTEGRFLPYFFPDVFHPGGEPVKEAVDNWIQARRAMMRKPIDRMGYGGYLSLALEFPEFVQKVEEICNEFREIHDNIKGNKPYSVPFKVAVLNCWGKLRSWQTHMVAHALWYKQIYSYLGVLESLSGMPVEVEFISFEDIKKDGVPEGIKVIINAGDAGTAWSGGANWKDEEVTSVLREWVFNGGGFIGIGEPTAFQHQGRFFQLADVLGVDKELGYSLSTRKYDELSRGHFITEDLQGDLDVGEGMKNVFGFSKNVEILNMDKGDINLAANTFGNGRAIYIAGLPYNQYNSRLLFRSILWTAGQEKEISKWFSTNPNTECAAYPQSGRFAVINNSYDEQDTIVYNGSGKSMEVRLKGTDIKWFDIV